MGLRAACELLRVEGGVGHGPGQLSLKYAFIGGLEGEESQISVLKFMKLRVGGRFTREGTCTHMADSHCYIA